MRAGGWLRGWLSDVSVKLTGRAGVRYSKGGRVMMVDSEILIGGPFSMWVDRSSIKRWEPPHQDDPVNEADRDQIMGDIRRVLLSRGYGEIDVIG